MPLTPYPQRHERGALRRPTPVTLIACTLLILSSQVSAGTSFGIYDARTLAMGGASVASANNDNAQFYNSALLAFNEEVEEKTRDSRFLFPMLVPQISESAFTIEELAQDDPTGTISRAVRDFNAAPDAANALLVVDAMALLDDALADLEDEDIFSDIYVGLAVSEPGKLQGAGFFFGARVLAGGRSDVTAEDRELLAAYQEGLTFIATDGAQGVARPELFDANGALINPIDDFDSSVGAIGVVLTEAGVAMSRQLELFGQPIAAGLSFKVQRADAFEDVERVVDDRVSTRRNNEYHANVNFDVGLVREFGERWRVGLAVKDIIPQDYDTALGTTIRMRPRARIGAAYQVGRFQVAADVDLNQNEPLGSEQATQEVAVGAEWAFGAPVKIRGGYRHDLEGRRDDILSFGVGTVWKRLALDLAYAGSDDTRAAALQFGIVF
jgi:hypothetical protein